MGKKVSFKNGKPDAWDRCAECGRFVPNIEDHNCNKKD